MKEKISYLDETLKRLPIIAMIAASAWWTISKLNVIETKIEKIELLSFKDKEVIDANIKGVQLLAQNTSNRTTEIEKDIIRIFAVIPTKTKIENENNH